MPGAGNTTILIFIGRCQLVDGVSQLTASQVTVLLAMGVSSFVISIYLIGPVLDYIIVKGVLWIKKSLLKKN